MAVESQAGAEPSKCCDILGFIVSKWVLFYQGIEGNSWAKLLPVKTLRTAHCFLNINIFSFLENFLFFVYSWGQGFRSSPINLSFAKLLPAGAHTFKQCWSAQWRSWILLSNICQTLCLGDQNNHVQENLAEGFAGRGAIVSAWTVCTGRSGFIPAADRACPAVWPCHVRSLGLLQLLTQTFCENPVPVWCKLADNFVGENK